MVCSHEKNNPYDIFAIKVTIPESGTTVGHLPMENSRVTKYILDTGARVYAVLTSTNYCVLPLVQGGLEIPCRVEIHMPSTVKNRELIGIYEKYVDTLYYQEEETNIAGSFELSESNTLCLVLSYNFLANIFWEAVNGCPWVLRSRSE